MRSLSTLHKYFRKYRGRLVLGLLFVSAANVFAVLPPAVVRAVLDHTLEETAAFRLVTDTPLAADARSYINSTVLWGGVLLLAMALLGGLFMFFMRQTLIVMSRLIEYDQKAEIYARYQSLDATFYKTHTTGDLMNRISEDVGRVRMYTGPAIMYLTNLVVRLALCVWGMARVDVRLTLFVVAPLPLLVMAIYFVNRIVERKSEAIQSQLSTLTATAQESFSGIRVIRSFVQEAAQLAHFSRTSEGYRRNTISMAATESVWFPAMNFFVGLSLLLTVLAGGYLAIEGRVTPGNIAEFVLYLNLLTFPISSLGWVATMIQKAAVSQRRIAEFLHTEPAIQQPTQTPHTPAALEGSVEFDGVTFTYAHTGVTALKEFSMRAEPGEKIAVVGRTGSGKSTLAHLLLRMYDATGGTVRVDGRDVREWDLAALRGGIAYAPQEAQLFSDTVYNNIRFGRPEATREEVLEAARLADLEKDIANLREGYETVIGERGVMLSGGQKQRLVLARALIKKSRVILMDASLSAVDTRTEQTILSNLRENLRDTTVIVITDRLFTSWTFDRILVLDNGSVVEEGTHEELMQKAGRYAKLYRYQTGLQAA